MGILDDLARDWGQGQESQWKDAARARRERAAAEAVAVIEQAAVEEAPAPAPYRRPAPAIVADAAPPPLRPATIAERLREPGGLRDAIVMAAILQRRGR